MIETHKSITIRDELLLDFEEEAKRNLTTKKERDDSYQFMLDNLETRFSTKSKNDNSLTKKDVDYIKTVLNNNNYMLGQAYTKIIVFLSGQKCKKTQKERQKYFTKRLNNDACIYLMRAIELLVEFTKQDYTDITAMLNMCNSEQLDFLDAYADEDGWMEVKDE